MRSERPAAGGLTRRGFLKRASIAAAGGFMLATVLRKALTGRGRSSEEAPELPKGSIFTPARGRRTPRNG